MIILIINNKVYKVRIRYQRFITDSIITWASENYVSLLNIARATPSRFKIQ